MYHIYIYNTHIKNGIISNDVLKKKLLIFNETNIVLHFQRQQKAIIFYHSITKEVNNYILDLIY